MKLSRRELLIAGAALAVPGCSLFRDRPVAHCPNDPAISDEATPLTIDAHAHVFNASDLQVQRFITLIGLKQKDALGEAISDLAGVLQNIGWETAPSASEELAMLQTLRPALDKCDAPTRDAVLNE